MELSKITLGTAQLGSKYGVANIIGKPDFSSAMEILLKSWNSGINSFDTAPRYGDSEELVGQFIESKIKDINELPFIISKLPPINIKKLNFEEVYNFVKKNIEISLKKLNVDMINYYLLHNPSDIFLKEGIIVDCLNEIKNEGFIKEFGISAYQPDEVRQSLKYKEITVIQIPLNLFDHRLITTGLLEKLKRRNYTIFARSIYLQGLFFILPEKLHKNLKDAEEYLIKLRALTEDLEMSIAKLAFLFIRDIQDVSSIIIGVEKIEQILENILFLKENSLSKNVYNTILDNFHDIPESIINPNNWRI